MKNSDFPEFDAAYNRMLLPDNPERFDILAANANFNIYHNDLWRGTARRFAESIVQECIRECEYACDNDAFRAAEAIKQHFGLASSKAQKFEQEMLNALSDGIDLSNQDTP
jgi:hypothetical protein